MQANRSTNSVSANANIDAHVSTVKQSTSNAPPPLVGTPTDSIRTSSSHGVSSTQGLGSDASPSLSGEPIDELLQRVDRLTAVNALVDEAHTNDTVRRFLFTMMTVERKTKGI